MTQQQQQQTLIGKFFSLSTLIFAARAMNTMQLVAFCVIVCVFVCVCMEKARLIQAGKEHHIIIMASAR